MEHEQVATEYVPDPKSINRSLLVSNPLATESVIKGSDHVLPSHRLLSFTQFYWQADLRRDSNSFIENISIHIYRMSHAITDSV